MRETNVDNLEKKKLSDKNDPYIEFVVVAVCRPDVWDSKIATDTTAVWSTFDVISGLRGAWAPSGTGVGYMMRPSRPTPGGIFPPIYGDTTLEL